MNCVLYSNEFSSPNQETISRIKSLKTPYWLGLIIGTCGTPKNIFYEKIVKSLNNQNTISPTGAELFFDKNNQEINKIWCNTADIVSRNFSSNHLYLRNILKYSSALIFFFEYTKDSDINENASFLSNLLNFKSNADIFICIKIASSAMTSKRLEERTNLNKFKLPNSKSPQLIIIEYENGSLDSLSCINELKILKKNLSNSKLTLNPRNFFKNFENPPQDQIKKPICDSDPSLELLEIEKQINQARLLEESKKLNESNSKISKRFSINSLDSTSFSSFSSISESQASKISSHNEEIKNITSNYLRDNHQTLKSLDSWYSNKKKDFQIQKDIIERVCHKHSQKFKLESDFKDFLESHKIEICNIRESAGSTIESTLSYIMKTFLNNINQKNDSEFLVNIAKGFLYQEIEVLKNTRLNDLNLEIDEIRNKVIEMVSLFKKDPYKYRIDENFKLLKNKYQNNKILESKGLQRSSVETLKTRLDEFEKTIFCIKKSIPSLRFDLMICLKCNLKGKLRVNDRIMSNIRELCIDNIGDKSIEKLKLRCSSCNQEYSGKELLNKSYEFQMDYDERIIGIFMKS